MPKRRALFECRPSDVGLTKGEIAALTVGICIFIGVAVVCALGCFCDTCCLYNYFRGPLQPPHPTPYSQPRQRYCRKGRAYGVDRRKLLTKATAMFLGGQQNRTNCTGNRNNQDQRQHGPDEENYMDNHHNNRPSHNNNAYNIENNCEKPLFNPKKVVILTKLTRLEFERRTNPDLNEEELAKSLKQRGSDYHRLLEKFSTHVSYLNVICQELEKKGIEHRLVQRWDYTEDNIEWADAIFTAGGDGTFLLAASKIRDRNKPVIGINTDPTGSEGYMCLLKKCPETQFPAALERLLNGQFNWLWRQRIRVTLSGSYAFDDPIELHDQQLMYPEYRWSEHVRENEDVRLRSKSKLRAKSSIGSTTPENSSPVLPSPLTDPNVGPRRLLPYLALNEVFVGESLSSRVSYYEIQVDDTERMKQKSSGITVCTGTGSTSWYFNINKLTDCYLQDLMKIINEELDANLPVEDRKILSRLSRRFNEQLLFSPSDLRMAYAVRDPVFNTTFLPCPSRGFAQKVLLKSRCFDAHLVIDGGMSYIFNDGAQALLEMYPEDALRTVVYR